MTTRRRAGAPKDAVVLDDGTTWAVFSKMTGRDFRFLAEAGSLAANDDPRVMTGLLDLVERRCIEASVKPAKLHLVMDSTRQSSLPSIERARGLLGIYERQIALLRLLARGLNPGI